MLVCEETFQIPESRGAAAGTIVPRGGVHEEPAQWEVEGLQVPHELLQIRKQCS